MEPLHQSPFLSDLDNDFHPSGLLPDSLNLSPHQPAFDSFDLRPSSPHYPATPSYNGSYQNSPYSAFSELEFDSNDDSRDRFDNDPLVIPPDDQDRSEYDPPNSGGLLMFDDNFMSGVNNTNRVSVSITPAEDAHSPGYYDHASPSSSNGGAESGAENDRRSPASSISSSRPGVSASPHLAFNQLRVGSPYHTPVSMPGESASPQMKPQSPPLLVIPDLVQPGGYTQDRPVIHAPEGDGVGPRLNFVPPTPVSGGEATQATGFRNNPISQGSATPSVVPSSSSWAHHSSDPSANSAPSQPASDFRSGAGSSGGSGLFNFPGAQSQQSTTADLPTSVQGEEYLLPPSPSRTRSKSDTSARPPQWQHSSLFSQQVPQNQHSSSNFASGRTVHMNDVFASDDVRPSSASAIQTSLSSGSLPHPYPFQSSTSQPSNYLSADFPLKRSNSEGNRGHRQSRSEDLRPTMLGPYPGSSIPNFPPSRHVGLIAQQSQFLHPPSSQPFARGHRRSLSGGSRERGSIAGPSWGGARVSPYGPSPTSSPSRLPEPLPDLGFGNGQTPLINNVYSDGHSSGGSRGETPGVAVARPNVTTTATADASMKRRINDAKFQCPVPGCGSTFTRHFNLKGHMRSHNDEKPFQCKWPGCGKGFARQHDCKRHEQLHSNHRPFTCDGCRKPFARLDALNRHLRSEGGSGCMKTQDSSLDQQTAYTRDSSLDQQPVHPKVESDWADYGAGAGAVMV
ncbi:hypothetical protein EI94DRAFT_1727542 [Lactarius quietus]|nr:hypothetical protein EI94DRAFT_1727542 [Lactarius quietus]